ncbi:MAG: hypothetical protein K2N94_09355, partial [Lachnospiraceae bacterium]|nr:hypothetical protein [Lachnospiraceae bacterium]
KVYSRRNFQETVTAFDQCFENPLPAERAGGGFFWCAGGIFSFVCKVLRYCYVENDTIQPKREGEQQN